MISREEALNLVRKYIKTENTIKHMIATEAIMRALARKFEPEKEDVWGMTGLIHDLDYEVITDPKTQHGKKSVEILKEQKIDVPEEVGDAILAHCYSLYPEYQPKNKMEWSILICDSLTGLITAVTLVRPEKKLASVEVKSVLKKFKQPAFAAGTRRDEIALCEKELGLPLPEFVELSLKAMQAVSSELGL